jgi:2-deoxystreptamine N-acetyl-D-glucosaminyltransferase/2-deoxystreptamine glucosyltransferase
MACGTPVVATDCGGIPDIVRDGRSGLLVPPGDAPRLAAALERLLGDGDLRARLSDGGRGIAAEHDWDRVTRSVEETLLSIAPGGSTS